MEFKETVCYWGTLNILSFGADEKLYSIEILVKDPSGEKIVMLRPEEVMKLVPLLKSFKFINEVKK